MNDAQRRHGVDSNRLRRAALRHVKCIAPARFLVEGKAEPEYLVDLEEPVPCQCIDARLNGGPCLHELAARLHSGDGALVLQLGRMLDEARQGARRTRKD